MIYNIFNETKYKQSKDKLTWFLFKFQNFQLNHEEKNQSIKTTATINKNEIESNRLFQK